MDNKNLYDKSLGLINRLEGYKTVLKNLHWSAENLPLHQEIDSVLSGVSDFEDVFAECMQGYMGQQYRPGDVQGDMNAMPTGSAGGLVEALEQDVFDFLNIIQSDGTLAGIVNVINDFQQSILKWKYLLRLCGGYPGDLIVEKPVRKGLKGMEMFVVDLG